MDKWLQGIAITEMRFFQLTTFVGLVWLGAATMSAATAADIDSVEIRLRISSLRTDNRTINDAYRIAIGDLVGNVQHSRAACLSVPSP